MMHFKEKKSISYLDINRNFFLVSNILLVTTSLVSTEKVFIISSCSLIFCITLQTSLTEDNFFTTNSSENKKVLHDYFHTYLTYVTIMQAKAEKKVFCEIDWPLAMCFVKKTIRVRSNFLTLDA